MNITGTAWLSVWLWGSLAAFGGDAMGSVFLEKTQLPVPLQTIALDLIFSKCQNLPRPYLLKEIKTEVQEVGTSWISPWIYRTTFSARGLNEPESDRVWVVVETSQERTTSRELVFAGVRVECRSEGL